MIGRPPVPGLVQGRETNQTERFAAGLLEASRIVTAASRRGERRSASSGVT